MTSFVVADAVKCREADSESDSGIRQNECCGQFFPGISPSSLSECPQFGKTRPHPVCSVAVSKNFLSCVLKVRHMSIAEKPGTRTTRSTRPVRSPHIKLTKYDVTVSALSTMALFAVLTLIVMICIWLSNLLPTPQKKQVIMLPPGDGGFEDGDPNATPNVESPEDASDDPSLANEETDVTELEEVVEQVVEVSENAAAVVAPNEFTGSKNTGSPGSADGTGGRPLGSGGPGRGGAKREQRWIVEFADKGDLKSYAAQLDFFGIELAAMFPAEGRLVYLSNMSADQPATREIKEGAAGAEQRLFMNWAEGSEERRQADVELFQKAGIDATAAGVLHFYSSETETLMATIEQEFGGHSAAEIRKTYFRVRKAGSGYEFYVQKQLLK